MSTLAELLLLAFASIFWPILLVVAIVALRAPNTARLLLAFLAGGLLTTITVGLVVIYALEGSKLVTNAHKGVSPAVNIVVGGAALLVALVLRRRWQSKPLQPTGVDGGSAEPEQKPGRIDQALARGAWLAFVLGVVLDVVPGPFPLVAMKDIAQANYSVAETVAILLCFYLIMFAFIEVPLIGYVAAPTSTMQRTVRFNTWLARNAHRLSLWTLVIVGALLIVRGIIALA
jgi:hypothetical protein